MMRRGEVWVANLSPPRGREIVKIRPVLIRLVFAPAIEFRRSLHRHHRHLLPADFRIEQGVCREAIG